MTIYRIAEGVCKEGATVRCQWGNLSRGVRPGWQGAQEGLREVEEAAKPSSSELRAEEFLNTAVPKELGPVGCSEGACREDVIEGIQVCVCGGIAPRQGWRIVRFLRCGGWVEVETLKGIEVQGRSHGIPLASSFGISPPPRGSTAYRRAIQVP